MDCGPACLRMIAKYYGKHYTLQTLRKKCYITHEGVSMLGISEAAESIGFRSLGVRLDVDELEKNASLPCILHWNQNHFVVLSRLYHAYPHSPTCPLFLTACHRLFAKLDYAAHQFSHRHCTHF